MIREPLYRSSPPSRATNGDIAAKVGRDLGLTPDPEQQQLLDAIYAEKSPGIPAAFEVCVVAPRQNIKSSTLEIAALTDLFVFGVPLSIWTAHLFPTARKAFEDMRTRILGDPEYSSRCFFRDSHGEEAITLHTGETLEFHARSTGGGRGFSCDRLTLDEALFLRDTDMGAILPTLVTRADAQVRYGASAGLARSGVLRGLRNRGRTGKDRSLAYTEYGAERRACADDRCDHEVGSFGCALDDRELWWQGNSALWAGRITEDALEHQRKALTPPEFMREFLSWWEDPVEVGGALDFGKWANLADPDAVRGDPVAVGADLDENRKVCLAVAWWRPDGGVQVMVSQDEARRLDAGLSVAAGAERLKHLVAAWGSPPVGLGGPALDHLAEAAGGSLLEVSTAEFAAACGDVTDRVGSATIHHANQARLNDSVRAARARSVGTDGRLAWKLKDAPLIGPLAAVTRAVHALTSQNRTPNFW